MLDLSRVTDRDVSDRLDQLITQQPKESTDTWRLLAASRELLNRFSFAGTRTYPRPDHPDPDKRKSVFFLAAGILVSLRTTLENEQAAMTRLMDAAQDDDGLFALTREQIETLIRPAGMAQQKSMRIFECIRLLRDFPGGIEALGNTDLTSARQFLLSLPGFGPKASDCMLTIGLGKPSMVVDVNVFRSSQWILSGRVSGSFSSAQDVSGVKERLDDALLGYDAFVFQIVHTMLLLHGKSMGRRGHDDERCIGSAYCLACSTLSLPI